MDAIAMPAGRGLWAKVRRFSDRGQSRMYPRCKRLLNPEWSVLCQLLGAMAIITMLCRFSHANGDVTATREVLLRTNKPGSCGEGWTLSGQSCYKLTAEELKWSDAQEKCRSMNSLLVEVENAREQEALNGFLNSQEIPVRSAWIGLSDLVRYRFWIWGSGRPMSFSKWMDSEPNNLGGAERCVNVWPNISSSWNDFACRATFPGVCQKVYCGSGWTSTRKSCYRLTDEATRDEAQSKCRSIDGYLVEIENSIQQEELRDFLRSQGENVDDTWIGLSDPRKNRVWKWDSGSDLTYSNWISGEPSNAGGEEYCVNLWRNNNFGWNDVACHHNFSGVCKQNEGSFVITTTTRNSPPFSLRCESHYLCTGRFQNLVSVQNVTVYVLLPSGTAGQCPHSEWLNMGVQTEAFLNECARGVNRTDSMTLKSNCIAQGSGQVDIEYKCLSAAITATAPVSTVRGNGQQQEDSSSQTRVAAIATAVVLSLTACIVAGIVLVCRRRCAKVAEPQPMTSLTGSGAGGGATELQLSDRQLDCACTSLDHRQQHGEQRTEYENLDVGDAFRFAAQNTPNGKNPAALLLSGGSARIPADCAHTAQKKQEQHVLRQREYQCPDVGDTQCMYVCMDTRVSPTNDEYYNGLNEEDHCYEALPDVEAVSHEPRDEPINRGVHRNTPYAKVA